MFLSADETFNYQFLKVAERENANNLAKQKYFVEVSEKSRPFGSDTL